MSIPAGCFLSTRQTAPLLGHVGPPQVFLGTPGICLPKEAAQVPLPISWTGHNPEMDGDVRPEPLLGSALIRGGQLPGSRGSTQV